MKLEELDDIFGVSLPVVKTQTSRYNVAKIVCSVVDILVVVLAGIPLYKYGNPSLALEISIFIAVFINMILFALV